MQVLIKLALLALTFFLVFINPAYIGKMLYYSLFPLLFLLVGLFYRVAYYVSEKTVRKVCDQQFSYSLFCAQVPSIGDGDLTRGRLVVTDTSLVLFQKDKKGIGRCKEVWRLERSKLKAFRVGQVLSIRKGITFETEDGEVRFVTRAAFKQKDALTKALGWNTAKPSPSVEGEAAGDRSFTEL
jgi:hypothetical protein